MLSEKAIKYFKENGYSFEQIQRISDSIDSVNAGNTISHDEMKHFIKTELFSNYKVNV